MAFMNQEKKAAIAAELKKIVPKNWKWSLSVKHHSTIVFTVASAPFAALGQHDGKDVQVNTYYPERFFSEETLPIAKKIIDAMNATNFNKSDYYTDYHHVGYYVNFNIGKWDKKFVAIK